MKTKFDFLDDFCIAANTLAARGKTTPGAKVESALQREIRPAFEIANPDPEMLAVGRLGFQVLKRKLGEKISLQTLCITLSTMMNLTPISIVLLLALSLSSCKRKKEYGIQYEESSLSQTVQATASAFAESGEKVETEPEIEEFFVRMGRASRSAGTPDPKQFISVVAMLESAESAGLFKGMSVAEKKSFRKGLEQGFNTQMPAALSQMAYDRHRIARVEMPSANQRIVFANHYDNKLNISTPMRWWMVRTERGWRIYDFEDLSVGLRTVGMIGVMMKAGVAKNPEPWIKDFVPIVNSMKTIDLSDPESIATLSGPMDRLLKHNLPTDIRRFASVVLVSAYMAGEDIDKAEQELLAAKNGGYDSPLAHYQMGHVLMGRGNYEKALGEFVQHIEAMGEDSDILESVSDCHFHLGEMEKARAAAERALDDNPSALNCLPSFVAASSKEQLANKATEERFAASGNAAVAYELALDYLLELEETDKARSLYQLGRKNFDDQELIDYYDEELAEADGN